MTTRVEVRMNPNFKQDVLKAAEQKLGIKFGEKQALEALQRNERVSSALLAHLASKGLIHVQDVSNMDTAPGEKDLLFTFFTERGRAILEGR